MRRLGICEEKGSGVDKVVQAAVLDHLVPTGGGLSRSNQTPTAHNDPEARVGKGSWLRGRDGTGS